MTGDPCARLSSRRFGLLSFLAERLRLRPRFFGLLSFFAALRLRLRDGERESFFPMAPAPALGEGRARVFDTLCSV